ncbi:MAG: hypothetical protein GX801_00065 [Fibrobacter sp.]|nr:hypothetical protein [Fibrobacter sp.]
MEVQDLTSLGHGNDFMKGTDWKGSDAGIFNIFLQTLMSDSEEVLSLTELGQEINTEALADNLDLLSGLDLSEEVLGDLTVLLTDFLHSLLPHIDFSELSLDDKEEVLDVISELSQELYAQLGQLLFAQQKLDGDEIGQKLQEIIDNTALLDIDKVAKIKEALHFLNHIHELLENPELTSLIEVAPTKEDLSPQDELFKNQDNLSNTQTKASELQGENLVFASMQKEVDDLVEKRLLEPEINVKENIKTEVTEPKLSEKEPLENLIAPRVVSKDIHREFADEIRPLLNPEPQQLETKAAERHLELSTRLDMQARIDSFQVVQQISTKIAGLIDLKENKMTLRLDPPELGKVQMEIELKPGELKVQMMVENQEVKNLLESNVSQLRESLEKQQIQIDDLEVSVSQEGENSFEAYNREFLKKGRRMRMQFNHGTKVANEEVDGVGADTGRRLGYNSMEIIA